MSLQTIKAGPPDVILGLMADFRQDPRPHKVNLGVGVYVDETGKTPVLPVVRRVAERVVSMQQTKTYLPIEGSQEFGRQVASLVLPDGEQRWAEGRVGVAQTPGGTGALRVGAEFLRAALPEARVWLSQPTWPNHAGIFSAAGWATQNYPYYNFTSNCIAWDELVQAAEQIPANDIVVLHAACHNPTGADPSKDQWKTLAEIAARRGWIPFFDLAYQGFAENLNEDRQAVALFAETGMPCFVAVSFSKNFGLYNERVGALLWTAPNAERNGAWMSNVRRVIRAMYSNPPAHGAEIVSRILASSEDRREWEEEVSKMCRRIRAARESFVDGLRRRGVARDFSYIRAQRGMFSFTGLSDEQVDFLREQKAVYVIRGGGRINVAGITPENVDRVCDAFAEALSR